MVPHLTDVYSSVKIHCWGTILFFSCWFLGQLILEKFDFIIRIIFLWSMPLTGAGVRIVRSQPQHVHQHVYSHFNSKNPLCTNWTSVLNSNRWSVMKSPLWPVLRFPYMHAYEGEISHLVGGVLVCCQGSWTIFLFNHFDFYWSSHIPVKAASS